MTMATERDRCSTGVPNADRVLDGGLLAESATLLRGAPGAGKTIFGLHFLTADPADTGLYINLGEPPAYLHETADRFDRPTDTVDVLDLSPSGDAFHGDSAYDLFHADEVERSPITESIRDRVDRVEPDRVLVDPITELRHLAPDERQFRTQVLGLIDFLKARGVTVVLTSQAASSVPDDDLQFLVDAVIDERSLGLCHHSSCFGRRFVCASSVIHSDAYLTIGEQPGDERGVSVEPDESSDGEEDVVDARDRVRHEDRETVVFVDDPIDRRRRFVGEHEPRLDGCTGIGQSLFEPFECRHRGLAELFTSLLCGRLFGNLVVP